MGKYCAIIPARKGSKRLSNKNMRMLAGKPLVQWSIESALKAQKIDQIVVTSDDEAILALAKKMGVEAIRRPVELAHDRATTFDAIRHALESLPVLPQTTVLLQPTSPLRQSDHIDAAIALMEQKGADAVISVCETEHSPLWSNTLPSDGSMHDFLRPELANCRSQDLPRYYRLNGAIYLADTRKLLEHGSFFLPERIYAYIMNRESSVDIDDRIDFLVAETLLRERMKNENKPKDQHAID